MYCQNHLDYNTFGNVLLVYDHLLCALIMSGACDTVWVCVPSCLCWLPLRPRCLRGPRYCKDRCRASLVPTLCLSSCRSVALWGPDILSVTFEEAESATRELIWYFHSPFQIISVAIDKLNNVAIKVDYTMVKLLYPWPCSTCSTAQFLAMCVLASQEISQAQEGQCAPSRHWKAYSHTV